MIICPAVPEILGGMVFHRFFTPQMLLGCQKQQMLLTVKTHIKTELHTKQDKEISLFRSVLETMPFIVRRR